MRKSIRFLLLMFVCSLAAVGQSFSSGSTGADGALDLTSGDKVVQLPPAGILNYTTVNIPSGRTLSFQNNLTNTPVIMLAQGAVNIAGNINISASQQKNANIPGPGGFYGGAPGQPGLGPGGGVQAGPANGSWVGPLSLVPIIGGSGSAGCISGGSAAGGGAIAIASSVSITMAAQINAAGGYGADGCSYSYWYGAAGAIRLVANAINVSGNFNASIVRLEAPTGQVTYTGSGTAPVIAPINPEITPTHPPSLTIISIAGYPVPSYAGGSFTSIDLMLPSQLTDPLPVVVQGTNLPVGSPVTVNFSGSSSATSTTATLAGTTASSTATVYISNLTRANVTYLFVSATFDPTLITQNFKQTGPNLVSKIELAAAPGEKTTYRFLRADGSRVELEKVSADLRRALGL